MNIRTARYYNENHQEGPDLKRGESLPATEKTSKQRDQVGNSTIPN